MERDNFRKLCPMIRDFDNSAFDELRREHDKEKIIDDNTYTIVYEDEEYKYYSRKKIKIHSIIYGFSKPINRDDFIKFCAKQNLITTNSRYIEVEYSRVHGCIWRYTIKSKMRL